MTITEKLYDLAMIDALPHAEEAAFAAMDDPAVCYDAVVQYLRFRPDVLERVSRNYK